MKPVTIKWLKKMRACKMGIKYFKTLDKKYSDPVELCKKLKDEDLIGWLNWLAYYYCRYINDIEDIREYIKNSYNAFLYCKYIKDIPEVRRKIVNSYDAYRYCKTESSMGLFVL